MEATSEVVTQSEPANDTSADSTLSHDLSPNSKRIKTDDNDVAKAVKVAIESEGNGESANEPKADNGDTAMVLTLSGVSAKRNRRKKNDNKTKKNRTDSKRYDGGDGYPEILRQNENFEKFYRAQQIVPPDEWDRFMSTLREPLPVSFRITGFRSECQAVKRIVDIDFISKLPSEFDSKARWLEFYPHRLAMQIDVSKAELRKCEHLLGLRQFIIAENECGNVSRQETVSMIPPILLDVRPGHRVLDMCAAPGSKTGQIIEMLHADFAAESSGGATADDDLLGSDSLVIANDSDYNRCYLLNHQMKRLQTPCLVITNHDAAQFPNIALGPKIQEADGKYRDRPLLEFDRVLCDVPCSGDGTLRKNIDMWKTWSFNFGQALHYRLVFTSFLGTLCHVLHTFF